MATAAELIAFIRECAVTGSEAQSLVEQAQDPDYWISLCPAMPITSHQPETTAPHALNTEITEAIDDYTAFGHCVVHDAFRRSDIEKLANAVTSVRDSGWPLIFAFVYDELWKVGRAAKLRAFVSSLIGSHFQPTVSFWVNHVPATRGGSGFPPHMDDVWSEHHTVTCWVPLTMATSDNGCVYVIERDSENPDAVDLGGANLTAAQVLSALPRVRALPAGPGSFLAWPNDTIHWGGKFLRGEQGRIALSFHFASAEFENVDSSLSESMLIDRPLPRFADRLRWVSQSLLRFRGRDPLLERFAPVAHSLIEHSGGAPSREPSNQSSKNIDAA